MAQNSKDIMATTKTTNKVLNEFTLFPKLLAEIQLKIWEFAAAAREPRVIKLKIWARNSVYDPKHAAVHKPLIKKWGRPYVPAPLSFLAKDIAFIPNAPMPAIYNTCATARSVLVKAFSSTLTFPDGTSIPFEPELDTVLIYNDSRRYNLKPLPCVPDNPATHPNYAEIFKEVKTVAVAHGAYLDNPDCPTSWFLKQFKSLKTLLLYKGLRMRF